MDDSTHARIPSGIVPYYSKSSYTIQVDIPETEVHDVEMFTFGIRGRLIVGYPHRERGIEKPILGEHPVISIATTYIDITILHLRKHQATVYLSLLSRRNTLVQAIINKLGELVPIHFQFVLGISDAQEHGTGTSALYGTLCISSWIRESSMIKDIVKVEPLDTRFKSPERRLSHRITVDMFSQIHTLDMIIITCLTPEEINTQQTAVETQVKLLFIRMTVIGIDMLQVESITQEYPSPSQIRT